MLTRECSRSALGREKRNWGEERKLSCDVGPRSSLDALEVEWPSLTKLSQVGLRWPGLFTLALIIG